MAGVITSDAIEAAGARTHRRNPRTAPAMRDVLESQDGFLARVIELLSHHERMALRLRHRDGLVPGAIAARMGLPESIVRELLESAESTVRAAQRAFIEALVETDGAPA